MARARDDARYQIDVFRPATAARSSRSRAPGRTTLARQPRCPGKHPERVVSSSPSVTQESLPVATTPTVTDGRADDGRV